MNKKVLIHQIKNSTDLSVKEIRSFLSVFEDTIESELVKGNDVSIKNFGHFYCKTLNSRQITLPSGDIIYVPRRRKVSFNPYKSLKSSIEASSTKESGEKVHSVTKGNENRHGHKQDLSQEGQANIKNITPYDDNDNYIFGPRLESQNDKEKSKIRYIGKFTQGEVYPQIDLVSPYPSFYIPANDTMILGYNPSKRTTKGVTERNFKAKLSILTDIIPEIQIRTNVSIPFLGSCNNSYFPDCIICWPEYNIYIDVEIDEPYDIESGTPIHFLNSRDDSRDVYLVEHGWCVIRIAEEQVVNTVDKIIERIKHYLYRLTSDNRIEFDYNEDINLPRWTYEEAQELANNHSREKLLDIPEKNYIISKDNKVESNKDEEYQYVMPAKYEEIEKEIEQLDQDGYTIISTYPNGYEYVFEANKISFIGNSIKILTGFDIIEQKQIIIPYYNVFRIENRKELYKKEIKPTESIEDKKQTKLSINYARLLCNPINIDYVNNKNIKSNRTALYLTYWFKPENKSNEEILLESVYLLYKNGVEESILNTSDFFCAYCLNRKELRTFRTGNITSLRIYNAYKPYPKISYGTSDIWDCLTKKKLGIVECLYKSLPEFKIKEPINQGNYANFLITQDKIDEAISIVQSVDKNYIVPQTNHQTWCQVVLTDFHYFIDNNISKENFSVALHRINDIWEKD